MVLFSPAWVERGQVVYAVPLAPTVDRHRKLTVSN